MITISLNDEETLMLKQMIDVALRQAGSGALRAAFIFTSKIEQASEQSKTHNTPSDS